MERKCLDPHGISFQLRLEQLQLLQVSLGPDINGLTSHHSTDSTENTLKTLGTHHIRLNFAKQWNVGMVLCQNASNVLESNMEKGELHLLGSWSGYAQAPGFD